MFTFDAKSGKITAAAILMLLVSITACFAYTYTPQPQWNQYKGDHFIIDYHPSIPASYIREFTKRCEHYYQLIAERLGFKRFDFWSWEERGRIFIYESRQEYTRYQGRPEWSAASVHVKKKHISTYYFAEDFFDSILPHELAHIILREYIGLNARVPLWFEEGVACANEQDCYLRYLLVAKGSFDKGNHTPVAEMEMNSNYQKRLENKFYPTAAAIIIFLLDSYNRDDFIELCRSIRDGSPFYAAMERAYGIRDAGDLNARFLEFLQDINYEDIATSQDKSINW